MRESHGEGVAIHTGPESCASSREAGGEVLTGVRAGWVLSSESSLVRGADAVEAGGRPQPARRYRESRRDLAESKTPSMYGNTSRENREIPCSPVAPRGTGRVGKSKDPSR